MIEEKHFASIDAVLTELEKEGNAKYIRSFFQLDGVDYLWTKDGTLVPSVAASFSSPYLYRGQVRRHRPCVPGVFRGLGLADHPHRLPPEDWVRCLVNRTKLEEFVEALENHPATAYAREIGLRTYPYGLAQHYELATDRIDLTQDHRVAAFFATNACENGIWSPATSGDGVLYRLHTVSFSKHFKDRLECLGKQALPRPGEQKAYALTLPLGMDFESLPIEVYTFPQISACGERINAHFNGGAALFPHDVMADIARAIRTDKVVPRSVLRGLMREAVPLAHLDDEVQRSTALIERQSSFTVSDRAPWALSPHQQEEAGTATEKMKETFLDRVGTLAVRRVRPQTAP